jgi:hypothetical protein
VYSITQAGTLSFAGGKEAKRDEMEWSTELSAEQRRRVIDMVTEFGWLATPPTSVSESADHVYEVSVRQRSTRVKSTVHGDNPQVVQMVQFLDEICMQRFDEFIDQLPRAGEPKR